MPETRGNPAGPAGIGTSEVEHVLATQTLLPTRKMPGERQGSKGSTWDQRCFFLFFFFTVAIFEANEEGQEHVKHLKFLKDSKLKVIQGSLWFRYAKADQSFWEAD